ncbi:zinc finger protein RFP-like isoform X2 [Trachemys scripta elegans]|uniref:zinc finger protein RFP-like isoform X2 n=1 Tax=Trachemys scripta elegans TaxID=31138 RepID=UPI0015553665|nr:zinc finger protein RFP-like isoform X2 [Trachemys scripta elegans]
MAAAGNPLKSLRDEATCSICLSFFKDPVSLDCGHSFCRACITQCWERPDADISCPQCRETFPQRTLRPNRQLGNMVEIAKQLSVPAAAAGGDLCNAHQEPFKLFCNQDQTLICVICRESQAHHAHRVVPIEEAAREHKDQIQTRLNTLKQEREELLEWKQDGEKQSQEYLDIRSTWSRCEKVKFEKPVAVPEDLRERAGISSQRNVCLQEALKKFQETLPYQLNFLISKAEKEVQATPDPDLANPCSIVSTDESVLQKYQDTGYLVPQNRFYPAPCVLGYKGFTSGRCYWEVEVGNKDEWVLGIAKESVIHEGVISCTPEEGIWGLQSTGNEYWALTSPKTALGLHCSPSSIGVYLDYEGEKVTFYDITSSGTEPIFTFTSSFTGKIIPFFGRRRVEFLRRLREGMAVRAHRQAYLLRPVTEEQGSLDMRYLK